MDPLPKASEPTESMILAGVSTFRSLVRDHVVTQDTSLHELRRLCKEIYWAMARQA